MNQYYIILYLYLFLFLSIAPSSIFGDQQLFDPDGSLKWVDSIQNMVREHGESICAMIGEDNSIFVLSARSSRRSPLHLNAPEKVFFLDGDTLMAFTGSLELVRMLYPNVQATLFQFQQEFGRKMTIEELTDRMADIFHSCTVSLDAQPFPINILLAGMDSKGKPSIFTVNCDGSYQSWNAIALGKHSLEISHILAEQLDKGKVVTGGAQLIDSFSQYSSLLRKIDEKSIFDDGTLLRFINPIGASSQASNNALDIEVSSFIY